MQFLIPNIANVILFATEALSNTVITKNSSEVGIVCQVFVKTSIVTPVFLFTWAKVALHFLDSRSHLFSARQTRRYGQGYITAPSIVTTHKCHHKYKIFAVIVETRSRCELQGMFVTVVITIAISFIIVPMLDDMTTEAFKKLFLTIKAVVLLTIDLMAALDTMWLD